MVKWTLNQPLKDTHSPIHTCIHIALFSHQGQFGVQYLAHEQFNMQTGGAGDLPGRGRPALPHESQPWSLFNCGPLTLPSNLRMCLHMFSKLCSLLHLNEKTFIIPKVLTVLSVHAWWCLTILGMHQRILTAKEMKWEIEGICGDFYNMV